MVKNPPPDIVITLSASPTGKAAQPSSERAFTIADVPAWYCPTERRGEDPDWDRYIALEYQIQSTDPLSWADPLLFTQPLPGRKHGPDDPDRWWYVSMTDTHPEFPRGQSYFTENQEVVSNALIARGFPPVQQGHRTPSSTSASLPSTPDGAGPSPKFSGQPKRY